MVSGRDRVRDLDAWVVPFLEVMGRKTRRTWAPLYLRGLLGPGERKSLQPMAARLGLRGHDQLQHVIASPAWNDGPLWTVLAHEADRLVGGPDAYLVIDDAALPKKGELSVGVARQFKAELGLGHFEGRSWTGLHRHALMTCIAFTYLQHLRLAGHRRTRRRKNDLPQAGAATVAELARRAPRHHRQAVHAPCPARSMPALPTTFPTAIRCETAQVVLVLS